jgi:pimeloyl-ACP methyl ester carboxylesterase
MRAPVLVGHSLGGTVALDVAIDRPASLAGVAVVDSLPIFPPLQPGETLASRREREPAIASAMMAASDADYAAGSRANIGTMVTDPAMADAVNAHAIKSDRATVVGSFVELAETDLTPHLAKIAVPVFVIASGAQYGAEATRQYFAAQFQGVPKVSVTAIPDARHFVMIDQPAAIQSALTGFLATLK